MYFSASRQTALINATTLLTEDVETFYITTQYHLYLSTSCEFYWSLTILQKLYYSFYATLFLRVNVACNRAAQFLTIESTLQNLTFRVL